MCYSFHCEEISDTNESLIPSSLWQIKQMNGLNVRAQNALKLLLILAGDIELCPGQVVRYNTNVLSQRPRLRGFKVAHLNVRSIVNKMDALKMLFKEKPFDIFTISETWLSQSILDSEVNISGYTLVRQNRIDRSGGGTAIFVREGIPYLHRKDLSEAGSEIGWIEVCRPNCKKQFICSVYKPPTYCCDLLINELNQSMAKIPDNVEITILGDFNVDFSASKKDSGHKLKQKLQTFAVLHNLEQLIKSPTRVFELTQSTIDLIFSNHYHRTVEASVIPCAISDHSLIYCTVKPGVSKGPPRIIEYRSYRTYNKFTDHTSVQCTRHFSSGV